MRRMMAMAASVALAAMAASGVTACGEEKTERALGVRSVAVAGGKLFALNEAFGRVVRIDPETGSVATIAVGAAPRGLAATGDGTRVVTLSPAEETLWAVGTGATGALTAAAAPVRPHHNAIAVSAAAAGHHAITFVDLASLVDVDVVGTASFNEVVVVDVSPAVPSAIPVVVGFNPRGIVFTPDATRALVLSASYASIVDLDAPADPVRIPLGANTGADPVTPETAIITPDSATALVARRANPDVFVITLDPPSVNIVDVGFAPSRFVASADGTRVVALANGLSQVAIIRLEDLSVFRVSLPGAITEAAVPPDPLDTRVILFGNQREELYVLDVATAEADVIRLVNPATKVRFAPGGETVVLHRMQTTPDGDEVQRFFDVHESLSVLDDEMRLVTPVALDAAPADVGFSSDTLGNPIALITLRETGRVAVVDLGTQLAGSIRVPAVPGRVVPLAPDPLAVAPIAIVHDQPFGLVTFLTPGGSAPQVVSGFLLQDSL